MLKMLFLVRSRMLIKEAGHLQIRTFKSELKIKWVRPEKIPCTDPVKSGDLKPIPKIDPQEVPPKFYKSEEMATASELVKRVFTLEFSDKKETWAVIRESMINSVRRHRSDLGSLECKIAEMTANVRCMQDTLNARPRKRNMRVKLKELIEKRKKHLKYLRRKDYKRFEWLLEKLDLLYRPPPTHFHWITRKESLKKLTDKHCEDLKQERLKAHKELLESQKIDFLTEKISKLKWIAEEETACGVEPTVSQSDIDKVVKQLEELKMEDNMKQQETIS